jgi:hypothetical protein
MKAEEAAKATSTKVMVSEILHSNSVEAGKAISIMVAPGERLGLNVTVRPGSSRGARIDAINSGCPFADKVTVGDTIMTINDKEVMMNADFLVGLDRTRKLGIILRSMQGDMGTKVETDVCVENYEYKY